MTQAFVFDLDGVIRHWDPNIVLDAERTHGLPAGALLGTAFQSELLHPAVTGKTTDEDWRKEVATRLQAGHPESDAAGAVAAWSRPHGEVIQGTLDVLAQLRHRAPVCLLSNATSRLNADLAALEITDRFDRIFNSSEIGFAKPDQRVYAHVEQELGVNPPRIVYIDDAAANTEAAAQRGWISLLSTPKTSLAELLQEYLVAN